MVLEPIFEADFLDSSYGFRPGRNAHQAIDAIRQYVAAGFREIYDADLKSYFDTIPHDALIKCLERRIADRSVLTLIRMWLESPIIETDEHGRTQVTRPKQGTPQGGVISPLLANLYLHWFEKQFYRSDGPGNWANAKLVRYADDFVVLRAINPDNWSTGSRGLLEGRFQLTVNREKTRIVKLHEAGSESELSGFHAAIRPRPLRSRPSLSQRLSLGQGNGPSPRPGPRADRPQTVFRPHPRDDRRYQPLGRKAGAATFVTAIHGSASVT